MDTLDTLATPDILFALDIMKPWIPWISWILHKSLSDLYQSRYTSGYLTLETLYTMDIWKPWIL